MWEELLIDSGFNEREVARLYWVPTPKMKASELAKELGNNYSSDAYSLSRLQEMGIVCN